MFGSCATSTKNAAIGENNIAFDVLEEGNYSNCFIVVTDGSGNASDPLLVSEFSVVILDHDGDGFTDFVELEYETDTTTALSTPAGILSNVVDFADDNDSDGFSDELEVWFNTNPNQTSSTPVDEDADNVPDGYDSSTDVSAPRLLAFSIPDSEKVIETGAEVVIFNMTVVDDVSGVGHVAVRLEGPTGQQVYVTEDGNSLGHRLHALSLTSSEFGEHAEAGTWFISYISVTDIAGNNSHYYLAELVSMGFVTEINIENQQGDTVAPVLNAFSISEEAVEIVTGNETVTFNFTVSDAASGIGHISARLEGPAGQSVYVSESGSSLESDQNDFSLVSNEFGEHAEAGMWSVSYVNVTDVAGNNSHYNSGELKSMGFVTEIDIENQQGDTVPPVLEEFSISEEAVAIVTGSETVTFNFTVSDVASGIGHISARLEGPAGKSVYVSESGSSLESDQNDFSLVSNEFGEYAEAGMWSVSYVNVTDVAGNNSHYNLADLVALGFESTIEVVNQ